MVAKKCDLQVTRAIKYINLEFEKYNAWNVKVDAKLNVLDRIKNFLKIKDPFSNEQIKVIDS